MARQPGPALSTSVYNNVGAVNLQIQEKSLGSDGRFISEAEAQAKALRLRFSLGYNRNQLWFAATCWEMWPCSAFSFKSRLHEELVTAARTSSRRASCVSHL